MQEQAATDASEPFHLTSITEACKQLNVYQFLIINKYGNSVYYKLIPRNK